MPKKINSLNDIEIRTIKVEKKKRLMVGDIKKEYERNKVKDPLDSLIRAMSYLGDGRISNERKEVNKKLGELIEEMNGLWDVPLQAEDSRLHKLMPMIEDLEQSARSYESHILGNKKRRQKYEDPEVDFQPADDYTIRFVAVSEVLQTVSGLSRTIQKNREIIQKRPDAKTAEAQGIENPAPQAEPLSRICTSVEWNEVQRKKEEQTKTQEQTLQQEQVQTQENDQQRTDADKQEPTLNEEPVKEKTPEELFAEASLAEKIKMDMDKAVTFCLETHQPAELIKEQGEEFTNAYWEKLSWDSRKTFDKERAQSEFEKLSYEEMKELDSELAASVWNNANYKRRFELSKEEAVDNALKDNLSFKDALAVDKEFARAYLKICDEQKKNIGATFVQRAELDGKDPVDWAIEYKVPASEVKAADKEIVNGIYERADALYQYELNKDRFLEEWKKQKWAGKTGSFYKPFTDEFWPGLKPEDKVKYDREQAKQEFQDERLPLEKIRPIEDGKFFEEYWAGLGFSVKKRVYYDEYNKEWNKADWKGKQKLDPGRALEEWHNADWEGKKKLDKDMVFAWSYFGNLPAGERAISYYDDAVEYKKIELARDNKSLSKDEIKAEAEKSVAKDILAEYKNQKDLVEHLKDQWSEMKSHSFSIFDSTEFSNMKRSFNDFTKAYDNIVIKGLSADGSDSKDVRTDLNRLRELQANMQRQARAYTEAKRAQKSGGISKHKTEQGKDRLVMADELSEFSLGIAKAEYSFEIDASILDDDQKSRMNAREGSRLKVTLNDLESMGTENRSEIARLDLKERRVNMMRREQDAAAAAPKGPKGM